MAGDIEEAICTHALYYAIWKKFGVLPERFNWQQKSPDVTFYPLRPEFAESTYLLYQVCMNKQLKLFKLSLSLRFFEGHQSRLRAFYLVAI